MSEVLDTQDIVLSKTVFTVGEHSVPYIVVPEDYQAVNLEETMSQPLRVRENIEALSVESFADYIKRFGDVDTIVKVDTGRLTFQAIIDYHSGKDDPAWCAHRANYRCQLSAEWQDWINNSNHGMSQEAFAEFLENHSASIVEPDGSEILSLVTKLNIVRKAVFGSAIRLATGELQFSYSEDNQKGTVEIPEKIKLGLPVFKNGTSYIQWIRLRYRLKEGVITFYYSLISPEKNVEDAFKNLRNYLKENIAAEIQQFEASI